ncbi:MAG: DUF4344 domain-containing metallopeptidase [Mycobacterium sp.]|nr:DUF4344 domain-containing metallopeptidase [Mycobacterium sp.]
MTTLVGAAATAALLVTGCAHNQPPQGQSGPTTAEVSSASQADPAQPADVNGNGKPDGDPSDGDWPGKMTVVYEDATTPEAVKGRQAMEDDNLLPQLADDINDTLKLPYDIPIKGTQCGEANDYWSSDDKAITLCYEDVTNSLDIFSKLGDADPGKSAFNTALESFYHEVGHMVIDVYDLPATGREEDAADQVSAFLLLRPNADGTIDGDYVDAIIDTARWYRESSAENGDQVDDSALADVHSPDKARMYNFECWAYGADPSHSEGLITDGLLPEDRADGCADEYAKLRKAWSTLLDPYLK